MEQDNNTVYVVVNKNTGKCCAFNSKPAARIYIREELYTDSDIQDAYLEEYRDDILSEAGPEVSFLDWLTEDMDADCYWHFKLYELKVYTAADAILGKVKKEGEGD